MSRNRVRYEPRDRGTQSKGFGQPTEFSVVSLNQLQTAIGQDVTICEIDELVIIKATSGFALQAGHPLYFKLPRMKATNWCFVCLCNMGILATNTRSPTIMQLNSKCDLVQINMVTLGREPVHFSKDEDIAIFRKRRT